MSKATEHELSALHKRVAETMTAALDQSEKALRLIAKYNAREEKLPKDIIAFLEDAAEVNPSLLVAATKFLKDNNISCDPAEDDNLKSLEEKLKNKKQKGNVTSIPFTE